MIQMSLKVRLSSKRAPGSLRRMVDYDYPRTLELSVEFYTGFANAELTHIFGIPGCYPGALYTADRPQISMMEK